MAPNTVDIRCFGDVASGILRPWLSLLTEIFPEDDEWKLRLEQLDDMIPKLVDRQDFDQQISNTILEMLPRTGDDDVVISLKSAGDLVRFFDSAIEILDFIYKNNKDWFEYMFKDENEDWFDYFCNILRAFVFKDVVQFPCLVKDKDRGILGKFAMKIPDTVRELRLVSNLLLLVRNHLDQDDEAVCSHLLSAQHIVAELSLNFCSTFVLEKEFQNFADTILRGFLEVRARINTLVDQIGMNGAFKKIPYKSEDRGAIDSFDDLCNELRSVHISRDSIMVPENVVALTDCDGASSSAPMVLECELKITKLIDQPPRSKLVGVKDAADQVTVLLLRGASSMRIISIVGMPGLGKTTLASHVYEDFSIGMHFVVRAWCRASQAYKKETLLFDLLTQFDGEINPETSGDDLAERLCRKLKGRRYLIVIDDVWDTKVWQDLQGIFPNCHNGSRVLFTTRLLHVALKANSQVCNLRLLSNQESCELLCCKVFDSGTCPPELSATSKQIARGCKGLPLAIVLVAGILRRAERSKESWDQVAGVKVLQGGTGDHLHIEQFQKILELSYKELPDALRPCFLSFAAFPEDTLISASKLIRLWISQGFVRRENCNLEEVAKSYLTELIDRSLVMIARRSSSGGVKACRVHDVLRDFCLAESKSSGEENLVLEEAMLSGILHLHHRSLMYFPNNSVLGRKDTNSERHPTWEGIFFSLRSVFPQGQHSTWKWIFSSEKGTVKQQVQQVQHIELSYNFLVKHQTLTELDLGKVRLENSADTCDIILIAKLVNLRFLGIRPRSNKIPAEIGNLLNLETLILTGVIGELLLPESLWKLSRLRNVLMDEDSGFFSLKNCSFSPLYDLKCVSYLSLVHGDGVQYRLLGMLPNLEKLACTVACSWDYATGIYVFPVLDVLNKLQSLKLSFYNMLWIDRTWNEEFTLPFFDTTWKFTFTLSLPSNLKKLSLSQLYLPWTDISVIMEQLPNLEVLKLMKNAFMGRQWDLRDCECEMLFPKLKFLKLDSLGIRVWNADEQFPCLEQLVVVSCPGLEEIPSCFGDIPTLQSIEMKWCSSSAKDSVQRVLRTQRELSNDQLKVTLNGSALV